MQLYLNFSMLMKNYLYGLLLFSLFCPASVFNQTFSIDDYLGLPYCSNLVSAADGGQIAWISTIRGVRSLYTAEAPAFVPQSRYQALYDDGQVIGNIRFDYQGKHLFFVRGSTPNRQGEIANPASEVVYPKPQLYRVNLESNLIDTLGSHSNYVISPDDNTLLILSGSEIRKLDLQSGHVTPMVQMRGVVSNVSFNAGGSAISFVSNRGDHSFIGLYFLGGNRIKWVDPSIYHDGDPVWSQTGNHLAFIRSPGDRKGALSNITGGNPFSIIVYDVETGRSKEIWTSPSDDGGFAQYYHARPLRWWGDEKIAILF